MEIALVSSILKKDDNLNFVILHLQYSSDTTLSGSGTRQYVSL